jgi:hypothetical protein
MYLSGDELKRMGVINDTRFCFRIPNDTRVETFTTSSKTFKKTLKHGSLIVYSIEQNKNYESYIEQSIESVYQVFQFNCFASYMLHNVEIVLYNTWDILEKERVKENETLARFAWYNPYKNTIHIFSDESTMKYALKHELIHCALSILHETNAYGRYMQYIILQSQEKNSRMSLREIDYAFHIELWVIWELFTKSYNEAKIQNRYIQTYSMTTIDEYIQNLCEYFMGFNDSVTLSFLNKGTKSMIQQYSFQEFAGIDLHSVHAFELLTNVRLGTTFDIIDKVEKEQAINALRHKITNKEF